MRNNTPFSTRLSGSAKETELRLRNIFRWKKKRPPVIALVLILAVILGCGGLVVCRKQPSETPNDFPDAGGTTLFPSKLTTVQNGDVMAELLAQKLVDTTTLDSMPLTCQTVYARHGETHTLILAEAHTYVHSFGSSTLLLGVWDETQKAFSGNCFILRGEEPSYSAWQDQQNLTYVLWTNQTIYQGEEASSGVGYFSFDGETLTHITQLPRPVQDNVPLRQLPDADTLLEEGSPVWDSHKAVVAGSGFFLYEKDPEWSSTRPDTPDSTAQWREIGYLSLADEKAFGTTEFSFEGTTFFTGGKAMTSPRGYRQSTRFHPLYQ